MSVQEVMTREVVHVSMDDTVEHARELFERHGFHHLVVEENGQIVGVLSDRDLLRNLSPFIGRLDERTRDRNLLHRKVHQIMTRELVHASPDTSILDASLIMLKEKVSCLPIVDPCMRCVGIVTTRDMLIWSLRCMHQGEDTSCAA